MKKSAVVLGVLGMCRVDFTYPTHFEVNKFAAFRPVCRVCWVYAPARACAHIFFTNIGVVSPKKKLYARALKPNTPNTPYTATSSLLNLKGFSCVGFVLGCSESVLGMDLGGRKGR